ncbi:hypothetical protein [Ferrovum sp.]|uniref:hypothetical protein n=1 Tax=Ferrovum sp. TaxID=2609467 RepID=UPI00262F379F|nr:hypothetical protein [Ferrovum sp.]
MARMTNRLIIAGIVCAISLSISGCGTENNFLANKTKTVEYYRIFDIKTSADVNTISHAASDGLGRNVNDANEVTPIPSFSQPPSVPGRFAITDPFAGTQLGMMMQGAGSLGLRIATCNGAVWSAKAVRHIAGNNNLNLTACLFQYKDGYNLDLYAVFTKEEGGLAQIGRDLASDIVGTPEQWTEKTFLDIVRSINLNTTSKITLLEAQPAISGTPWLDKYDK